MKKPFVRGFSLAEVLVTALLGSIVLVGLAEFMARTLRMGQASRVNLIERDFLATINKILEDEDSCKESLKPANLFHGRHDKGIGKLTTGLSLKLDNDPVEVVPLGTFKDSIEVVKMTMKPEGSTPQEKTDNESKPVRVLTVLYKKIGLGKLNTVAEGECTANETGGCFKKKCKINYKLASNKSDVETCKATDCHGVGIGIVQAGIGPKCPWGQIYKPGENPECDPRNTTEHLGANCKGSDKGVNFIGEQGNDVGSGRVVDTESGKCVCKFVEHAQVFCGNRVLTAEGLCVKKCQVYGAQECWPRNGGFANEIQKKLFCSKKYQGSEVCIRQSGTFYKRLYNRETGRVRCASYAGNDPPDSWFLPQNDQ